LLLLQLLVMKLLLNELLLYLKLLLLLQQLLLLLLLSSLNQGSGCDIIVSIAAVVALVAFVKRRIWERLAPACMISSNTN